LHVEGQRWSRAKRGVDDGVWPEVPTTTTETRAEEPVTRAVDQAPQAEELAAAAEAWT
jgi:hypothetical protein